MKDIHEVLRQKENELQKVQKEIEVLRLALRLLSDDAETIKAVPTPGLTPATTPSPARAVTPVATGTQGAGYSAAWDNAPKHFP